VSENTADEKSLSALLQEIERLSDLYVGKYAEALALCDDVLTRFASSNELTKEAAAFVWLNKGKCLRHLERYPEAFAAWQHLLDQFGSVNETSVRKLGLDSLIEAGDCHYKLNESEQEIATYDVLFAHFAGTVEPELLPGVAKAMLNKGLALATLKRHEEAIALFDQLLAWPPADPSSPIEDNRLTALLNKGRSLRALNHPAEAIAVYDDLLARKNAATEEEGSTGTCQLVTSAYEDKAAILVSLGKKEEAAEVYKEEYAFCRRNMPKATYGMEEMKYLYWYLGKTATMASDQIKLLIGPPASDAPPATPDAQTNSQ
jgi:tetratricopeptide (TPR) repeat protein